MCDNGIVRGQHNDVARVRHRNRRHGFLEERNRHIDADNSCKDRVPVSVLLVNRRRVNSNRFPDKVTDKRLLPKTFLQVLGALVPGFFEVVLALHELDFVTRILGKAHDLLMPFSLGSHSRLVSDNHGKHLRKRLAGIKDSLSQEVIEILPRKHLLTKHFGIFIAELFAFFEKLFNDGDIGKTDLFAFFREQRRKLALHFKTENPKQRRKHDAESD